MVMVTTRRSKVSRKNASIGIVARRSARTSVPSKRMKDISDLVTHIKNEQSKIKIPKTTSFRRGGNGKFGGCAAGPKSDKLNSNSPKKESKWIHKFQNF